MSRGSPPRNDARVEGSPAEALATARDRLRGLLVEGPQTARSLSEAAGLPEKDVLHHLGHLARSAPARAERLEFLPSRCLACDFVFADRDRLTRPGRCPACRSNRITPPRFAIVPT